MPVQRTLWIALGATVAVLGCAAAAAFALWLPSDEELARRASERASALVGVPVVIGRLHWSLLPQPQVVLYDVRTEQAAPLSAQRISAQARWSQLLSRRFAITDLQVEDVTVPQLSLSEFKMQDPSGDAPALPLQLADIPLEHAAWADLRWVTRRGRTLAYAGDVDFDTAWRPRRGVLERPGASDPARMEITRHGTEDRWRALVTAGGRTEEGELQLQQFGERYRVTGAIDFTGVDVVGMMAAFERRSVVAGKASGHTDLIAEGAQLGEAARSLNTRTRFSVAQATVLVFDLQSAVKTAGAKHKGTTPLDSLTGVVRTEGHEGGTIVRFSELKGTSGALTASGDAVLQDGRISGHVAVDLVDGVVGVPLEFGGTVAEPTLGLPPAAAAGAAIGTVIAPGVGTVLGARIGESLRRLFGSEKNGQQPPPPKAGKSPAAPAPEESTLPPAR